MNTFTKSPIIEIGCEIENLFSGNIVWYGEAVRSLSTNQAANYISVGQQRLCSVDDTRTATAFVVRESANVDNVPAGGTRRNLSRRVNYTMAVNSKNPESEYQIVAMLNNIVGVQYNGTSFEQDGIAASFFGVQDRNFETHFFTISFSVVETIVCERC